MKAPAPADLQRWSEEVARDPSSLAFLPLARAFRKQGRRDAALKLCLRGLEHHPTHVEAHAVLAMLYFESGQRAKAYDEWSMVLRLEPDNFEALRGMGFYHLEQGDDVSALRSLQRAGAMKPSDLAVQEALRMIHERQNPDRGKLEDERDPWEAPTEHHLFEKPIEKTVEEPPRRVEPERSTNQYAAPTFSPPPVVQPPPPPPPPPPAVAQTPMPAPMASAPAPAPPAPATVDATALPSDPNRLFDSILRGGQVLGALIVDSQGLVLAGSLPGETGTKAEALGAILGGAIEEAARASAHLALGHWKGILLESEGALLHLAPVRDGMIVLLAAKRETPAGWMLRSAHQASALATRFLEAYG